MGEYDCDMEFELTNYAYDLSKNLPNITTFCLKFHFIITNAHCVCGRGKISVCYSVRICYYGVIRVSTVFEIFQIFSSIKKSTMDCHRVPLSVLYYLLFIQTFGTFFALYKSVLSAITLYLFMLLKSTIYCLICQVSFNTELNIEFKFNTNKLKKCPSSGRKL